MKILVESLQPNTTKEVIAKFINNLYLIKMGLEFKNTDLEYSYIYLKNQGALPFVKPKSFNKSFDISFYQNKTLGLYITDPNFLTSISNPSSTIESYTPIKGAENVVFFIYLKVFPYKNINIRISFLFEI